MSFRHIFLSLSLSSLSTAKVPLQTATMECTISALAETLTFKWPIHTGIYVVESSLSSLVKRSLPPTITGYPEDTYSERDLTDGLDDNTMAMGFSTAKVPLRTATAKCTISALDETFTFEWPMPTESLVIESSLPSLVERSYLPTITGYPKETRTENSPEALSITTSGSTDDDSDNDSDSDSEDDTTSANFVFQTLYTTMSPTSVSSSSAASQARPETSSITLAVNDQNGPGINNMPMKAIKGQGKDGKKVTYPNKTGFKDCSKKCSYTGKYGPVSCLDGLMEKIHEMVSQGPYETYKPLQRIACAPDESRFCA